jgi:response regulator of citrate/malate metabolism
VVSPLTGDGAVGKALVDHLMSTRSRQGEAAVLSVLIVEDELTAGEALVQYVGRVPGFTVAGLARSGADALQRLTSDRFDLVMMDICLPDLSGLEVLRRMRASGCMADFIAVTRSADLSVVRAAVSFGAVQYLLKPFTCATVRRRLERYQLYRLGPAEDDCVPAQQKIDHLLGLLRDVHVGGLPKGISPESLRAVVAAVKQAGVMTGLSALEVANASGTSRVTARRYLEYLAESGVVVRGARYGGAGRPEVEYRVRQEEPTRHAALARLDRFDVPGRTSSAG